MPSPLSGPLKENNRRMKKNGFWHIHVERIFCEKRRRGRGKKREKEEKKKEERIYSLHFKPCIITMGFIIAINFQGQLMKNDEE